MNNSLILLDPFRSALVCQAVEEDIILPNLQNQTKFEDTIIFKLGNDKKLRAKLLQLLLLYPNNKIIQDENGLNLSNKFGQQVQSLLPLKNFEISFVSHPDEVRKSKWSTAKTISDLWEIEKDFIEEYEEIIIGEMAAKGLINREQFFNIKAYRLGKSVESKPNLDRTIEMLIFTRVNELHSVQSEKMNSPSDVGHFEFSRELNSPVNNNIKLDNAYGIYRIVVEELAKNKISFPIPTSLAQLNKLRNDSQVNEFRQIFQAWMNKLTVLDFEDEKKLRRELTRIKFKSKAKDTLKVFDQIMTYISLPLGIVTGPELGIGLGLTQIGLNKLAEHWQKNTAWLSFGA